MQFGDIVVYTENGQEYQATVLRTRDIDDHSGADGEPLIDLAFFKQVMVMGIGPDGKNKMVPKDVVGTQSQLDLTQFRIDVAHESHEFSSDAKRRLHSQYNGTQIPEKNEDGSVTYRHHVVYPGGRWRELPSTSYFTGKQRLEE